jgi:hypothetical protein
VVVVLLRVLVLYIYIWQIFSIAGLKKKHHIATTLMLSALVSRKLSEHSIRLLNACFVTVPCLQDRSVVKLQSIDQRGLLVTAKKVHTLACSAA